MSHFRCLGSDCPNHCCGPYSGISPLLRPLGHVKMSEIILLPQDAEALKAAGAERFIRQNENGVMIMDTSPDGTCAALKNGRCEVYDSRPAICKAYPLYLDMFAGVCALEECKAVSSDLRPEDLGDALRNLLDIYQYWIDFYRQKL